MKRKLIDFDVFKKIKSESLSAAEVELRDAEDILSKAINADQLQLHCFGEADVTYETPDKSYVHATYKMNNNTILFENIEELVIDEQTAKKEAKSLLSTMVEELLDNLHSNYLWRLPASINHKDLNYMNQNQEHCCIQTQFLGA